MCVVQSDTVCSGDFTFEGDLVLEDLDTGETMELRNTDFMVDETNVTVVNTMLRENRHYNVTVTSESFTFRFKISMRTNLKELYIHTQYRYS